MKRHDPQTFGELFDHFVDRIGARDTFEQQRICFLWPEVMGPTINRYTVRRWVDGGTLHVVLTSAALKSELGMMRRNIIDRLNQAAGKTVISELAIH
ncbi:MAG: DUF721 domain-containing protein [Muribaculaceae bacterium]|nr:DUF721 domain-containing protein [Muribaculaceae bacterium]MDE6542057.1 DUF721 domain-containing protein [Muribaculaceae bacterium]